MTTLSTKLSTPLAAVAAALILSGCGTKLSGDRAFISYWPPAAGDERLRLAVKDNIDMKGQVTTAGSRLLYQEGEPATSDAPALAIAREREDVVFVGKTNLSEFAVSPSGFNEFFGTAKNPLDDSFLRDMMPGGSSSGSAVAVATGMADVAFGTDTAGSVRVPAACTGVVGLKTTFGLIPIDGIHPIEPQHLDTVGPLGKDIAHTAKGMELLRRGFAGEYQRAQAAQPSAAGIRVGRLYIPGTDPAIDQAVDDALRASGFQVVVLDKAFLEAYEQAKTDANTIAAAGAWMSDKDYRLRLRISMRTRAALLAGRVASATAYPEAVERKALWQRHLAKTFRKVDFLVWPTLKTTPPYMPIDLRIGVMEARFLALQNTAALNYSGNPALAMPVPLADGDIPVTSLQLIGPRRSEARLLNAGRLIEKAVGKSPAGRGELTDT